MNKNTQALLTALESNGLIDEWWETDLPNVLVVAGPNIGAVRITVEPATLPTMSPAEWQDSGKPHPFGWKA